MNRFGIVITKTYWLTLGLSTLFVLAFTLLDIFFPSYLWTVASAAAIVLLGRVAAKSCAEGGKGFPIGRAFLWSYISFVLGSMLAYLLSYEAGWSIDTPISFDYAINSFSDGNGFATDMNRFVTALTRLIQLPETILGFKYFITMYGGVFLALITGALIKNQ